MAPKNNSDAKLDKSLYMSAVHISFVTPDDVTGRKRWLLYSPAARFVLFLLPFAAMEICARIGLAALGWVRVYPSAWPQVLAMLAIQILPAVLAYGIVVCWIERRRMQELALRDIADLGLGGYVLGFVLFSAVVGLLWLAGSYHVTGANSRVNWFAGVLLLGIGPGIVEEIVFRGALFRMAEEGLGTWWGLVISAAFFGGAHIANPGATWLSSVAIMIEAGLLLALLYHVTRSLWACIGLHAAWDTAEGLIYGLSVSGHGANRGWLESSLTGPDWLSGGRFGAEASVVAVAVCLVPTMILVVIAVRRHSVVPPAWQRRRWRKVGAFRSCTARLP